MENKELIVAIENLTESVGSLNAIQNDIFNQDTSHDDMVSLKGKMRLIKEGPKWQPAKQNGHFVRAYILQPITFQVSNGDNEQILNKIPIITLKELLSIGAYKLLGIPEKSEALKYSFSMDLPDKTIVENYNTGNNYTESTISNMKRLKKGAIIYFDSIRMEIDGEEKKLASRVFRISE